MPYEEIDPIYFERTYFLGPAAGGERVYALLVQAMEESNLAAIAKYVMRSKQHLGCLRIREGVDHAREDVLRRRDPTGRRRSRRSDVEVDKRELEMARQLIEAFSGHFEIEKYEDTYRDALCEIIAAKRKGKKPPKPKEEPERPPDLLEALRASLDAAGPGRGGANAGKRRPRRALEG